MNLKKLIPAITILLLTKGLYAQDASIKYREWNPNLDYRYGIQLAAGLFFNPDYFPENNRNHTFSLCPSFQWHTHSHNFIEAGIDQLHFSNNDYKNFQLALRYEYVFNFMKHSHHKWLPAIGIGATPFVSIQHYRPDIATEYAYNYYAVGTGIFVAPRFTYFFSPKWYALLSVPLNLMRAAYTHTYHDNPNIIAGNKSEYVFNFDGTTHGSSIRLGAGFKF